MLMDLPETFKAVVPSVVAFIRLLILSQDDTPPVAPGIFATGFVVDPDGIVVTNRHVVEVFDALPRHPTTGKPGFAAMLYQHGGRKEGKDYGRWFRFEPKKGMVMKTPTRV